MSCLGSFLGCETAGAKALGQDGGCRSLAEQSLMLRCPDLVHSADLSDHVEFREGSGVSRYQMY